MSKNMTKKGLALGAGIALVASAFVAAPASADTTGPITLVPSAGTTFNSILQSGITLSSEIDPITSVEDAGTLAFLIENPGAKAIGATFDTHGSLAQALTFQTDTSPATTAFTGMANANRLSDVSEARLTSNAITSSNKFVYMTGFSDVDDGSPTFAEAAARATAARAEVQTIDELLVAAGVVAITLPNGTVINHTLANDDTDSEIATALQADVSITYATITATAGAVNAADGSGTVDVVITFTANGNQKPVTLTNAGGSIGTVTETTKGSLGANAAGYNFGSISGASTLAITTTETTANVTLYVTAWLDANGDGKIDTFEKSSDRETVILYAPGNVSATTTVDYLLADNSAYRTTVAYNNNINPFQVAAKTYGKLFNGGTVVDVSAAETDTTKTANANYTVAAIAASATAYGSETTIGIAKNTLSVGVTSSGVGNAYYFVTNNVVDMAAGTYTAQTYYLTAADTYVAIGAASAAYDLNVGISSLVDTLDASVTETANLDFDGTSTVGVRTGTKSFDIAVQAQDGGVTLAASNLKIKATVTAVALTSGAVSVTGSSAALAEDGVTVAYGYTNSKGIATFSIGNTVGTKADQVTAKFEILKNDGTWADAETVTATWADATLASWSSVGGNYTSGETVSLSFKAIDQFGEGVSVDDSASLSVVATAYVGGIAKPLTYSKTTAVVDGVVAFSFANYAVAGGSAQLSATLNAGSSAATPTTGSATIVVNVYNSNATASVTVADSFSSAINYADNVTGSKSSSAVTAAATASGIAAAASATITGNVLDVNGVGQPGAAVTLSADGVLFADTSAYAEDTITTYANEYGSFSVTVYSHAVNAAGAKVSIVSGSVSTSTLYKSYLPNSINDENLAFSWNIPAELVKNTTYAVVATLTDKWSNPIGAYDTDAAAGGTDYGVAFQGTGAIEVNGVGTTVYKDFNAKGEATVFVRSIKDIAGPGAVSATISGNSTYATGSGTATSTLGTVGSSNTVDDTATVWDETLWSNPLSVERDVKDVASVATTATKVNAGSFKGYVALYAKGYAGKRMSAKVGKDWVVVAALASNFERVVEFTGAGVDVAVRIYIDRVLMDTINLTTK